MKENKLKKDIKVDIEVWKELNRMKLEKGTGSLSDVIKENLEFRKKHEKVK